MIDQKLIDEQVLGAVHHLLQEITINVTDDQLVELEATGVDIISRLAGVKLDELMRTLAHIKGLKLVPNDDGVHTS